MSSLLHLFHNQGKGSPMGGGAALPYYVDRVKAIQTANLLAYWPLSEVAGAVADNYEGTAARDAAYSAGIELANAIGPDGINSAPRFDGSDYINIYTASLNAAFTGGEFTVALWVKANAVGDWTDATVRRYLGMENVDGNSYIRLSKTATNNRITADYRAGTTLKQVNINSVNTTAWFHLAMTVSKTADEMKLYLNGVQTGITQTGLGSWPGTGLVATQCNLGAYTQVPSNPHLGWLAHAAVWKIALTPAEVLSLANPT